MRYSTKLLLALAAIIGTSPSVFAHDHGMMMHETGMQAYQTTTTTETPRQVKKLEHQVGELGEQIGKVDGRLAVVNAQILAMAKAGMKPDPRLLMEQKTLQGELTTLQNLQGWESDQDHQRCRGQPSAALNTLRRPDKVQLLNTLSALGGRRGEGEVGETPSPRMENEFNYRLTPRAAHPANPNSCR